VNATSSILESPSPGALVAGKYELVERIAEGGMGMLWRAVHRGLGREVALKLVDMEEPGRDERIARIVREAEICAAVRHQYVVEIFDTDTTACGQPFIVMELLRGETLAQRTARAPPMRLDELVGILARCLSGLHAVHEAGVVHRDLKPDNIVLTTHPEEGVVPKIVDFGISCREWRLSRGAKRLTRQGTVIGTPWYMSPEQACAVDEIGPQADIYAMGVIAYESLTGRLPFDSDSLVALLLKITTEQAPPLAYFRPDLPEALSRALAKAMARAPEARFETAHEMRDALLRAIEGAEPAYAAIVPSESVMVLPENFDHAPTQGALPAKSQDAPSPRPRGFRARTSSVVASIAFTVLGAVGAHFTNRPETDLAPPQAPPAAIALESIPPAALPGAPATPSEPSAEAATGEELEVSSRGAEENEAPSPGPRPRVRRIRRNEAPVAFRQLDF
jgi:eukaryotic-like serine/threonine-protein kinase